MILFLDTEIKSTGFTYIDDTLPDEIKDFAFPEEVRKKMLLVTDQQVYDELHELLMKEIQSPIQLVFRDSLCLDCGTKGDERQVVGARNIVYSIIVQRLLYMVLYRSEYCTCLKIRFFGVLDYCT